jgi:hypothetical protein
MQDKHRVLIRRATAALAVSVALHLALVAAGGSLLLGGLLATLGGDTDPLIVEVVPADPKPATPAAPTRSSVRQSRMPTIPVVLPPVLPLIGEEMLALAEPGPVAEVMPPETDVALETVEARASERGTTQSNFSSPPASREVAQETGTQTTDEQLSASAGETPPTSDHVVSADDPAKQVATADHRVSLTRLDEVTRNPSVSARTAGESFVGRKEVFEFLLDHPDFATHVTRTLRLGRYRMWRTDEGLFVDDGWGSTGQVFVVRATSGTRVLYARGEFQHKLLPPISGEAVVTISYDVQPGGDGRDHLVAAISSQLKIDGAFGDLIVKLANSVATEKAEKESKRLVRTFARVLQAIDEKPAALYASLLASPEVPQRELEQFRILLKLP